MGKEWKVMKRVFITDKEEEANAVAVRVRGKGDVGTMQFAAFQDMVLETIKTKAQ